MSQEIPEVRFRSLPISGSSVRPSTLSLHIHQIYGCSPCSTETSRHPYIDLSRRLAHSGSVSGNGSSASKCRPWPHSEIGVETQCKEECARTIPVYDIFGSHMELDYDVGTHVSRTYRVNFDDGIQGKARPGHHCEAISKNAGPHGSDIQHHSFGACYT